MGNEELFKKAEESVVKRDQSAAEEIAKTAIRQDVDLLELINKGYRVGIMRIGELFGRGEIFLPELIEAAELMKAVNRVLMEAIPVEKQVKVGKVVIGTVQGDIHDIGKIMVVSMLQANGFEVLDLGHDVHVQKFLEKAQEVQAQIIGTSALLTSTMNYQKSLEEELKKAGLRNRFKTMVGGAPVTQRWADRIGADGYAEDAGMAVKRALELLRRKSP